MFWFFKLFSIDRPQKHLRNYYLIKFRLFIYYEANVGFAKIKVIIFSYNLTVKYEVSFEKDLLCICLCIYTMNIGSAVRLFNQYITKDSRIYCILVPCNVHIIRSALKKSLEAVIWYSMQWNYWILKAIELLPKDTLQYVLI